MNEVFFYKLVLSYEFAQCANIYIFARHWIRIAKIKIAQLNLLTGANQSVTKLQLAVCM